MGWVKPRTGTGGRTQFTAVYRDIQGRERSAGTWETSKQAVAAWHRAEDALAAGRIADPKRGRRTFRDYVEQEWLPAHVIEASTRESYGSVLGRHILPTFGGTPMREIHAAHVREWILKLQRQGVGAPTIRKSKAVLDAIFTTALNDQVTLLHPGKGLKTPPVPRKAKRIINPAQFQVIYNALPDDVTRLLVEVDIESGLRWGELTELRVGDLDLDSGILTIARAVVELNSGHDGPRFLVKDYPKDKDWRQVKLATGILSKLAAHIQQHGLRRDDLLFAMPQPSAARRRTLPDHLPDPATLGLTEPNAKGKRYPHGTATAYGAGRCRCKYCRDAVAAYRAARRAAGMDRPREPRSITTDGHISSDWFRKSVWAKALEAADLGFHVTPHGMRHAHASWLLAGGADIQVVKERLGHASITTTEKYLHSLSTAQDQALGALDAMRVHDRPTRQATAAEEEIVSLRQAVAQLTTMIAGLGQAAGPSPLHEPPRGSLDEAVGPQ